MTLGGSGVGVFSSRNSISVSDLELFDVSKRSETKPFNLIEHPDTDTRNESLIGKIEWEMDMWL